MGGWRKEGGGIESGAFIMVMLWRRGGSGGVGWGIGPRKEDGEEEGE